MNCFQDVSKASTNCIRWKLLDSNKSYWFLIDVQFFSFPSKSNNCPKIIIFKRLALSKLLPIHKENNEIHNEIIQWIQREFLWNSSNVKIKHKTVCNDFQNGCLKNVDISSKIFISRNYTTRTPMTGNYRGRAGSYLINIFQIYKYILNRKNFFKSRFISKIRSYILEFSKNYFKSIIIFQIDNFIFKIEIYFSNPQSYNLNQL